MKGKFDLKSLDWKGIAVLGLSTVAYVVKGIYDRKCFDANLNRQFDGHLEDKVSKIVDMKLKKGR